MDNKQGFISLDTGIILAVAVVVIGFLVYVFAGDSLVVPGSDGSTIWDKAQQTTSYAKALGNDRAKPLDYIFGGIPDYFISWTRDAGSTDTNYVAPIVMMGIWLLFLLTFGDILSVFGFYSRPVAWLIAVILVIIAANLKIIAILAVTALTATAFLGAFSVVASIVMIFGVFLAFHFGTSSLRRKIVVRRAEDEAIKIVAGGKKAAAGVSVLKEIGLAAED